MEVIGLHWCPRQVDTLAHPPTAVELDGWTVQVAEGQGRWLFERLTTTMILEWLEGPDAEEVRDKRRVELALIDASDLVVVVSPQEVELIKHYRPDTKVRGAGVALLTCRQRRCMQCEAGPDDFKVGGAAGLPCPQPGKVGKWFGPS